MWNTKSDTFGWNLDRNTSNSNYHCDFYKEDNKCAMSSLIHCDYRKDGRSKNRSKQKRTKKL